MSRRTLLAAAVGVTLCAATPLADAEYREGLFAHEIRDFESARTAWEACAVDGDYRCEYGLGVLYSQGQGVPKDYARAAHWFERAARQGSMDAQLELGVLHAIGGGELVQDVVQALVWFTLAARGGDPQAEHRRDLTRSLLTDEEIEEARNRVKAWNLERSSLGD